MTKEELRELIRQLNDERRARKVAPVAVDFRSVRGAVLDYADAEMKRNMRTLYEDGEIVTHRTLNGTSIEVAVPAADAGGNGGRRR